jgi:uncharacterized protein YkwD
VRSRFGPSLLPFFLLAAAPALLGCTREFWDRSPRVAGEVERPEAAPAAPRSGRPESSQDLLPPPTVRPGYVAGQPADPALMLPRRPEPIALSGSPDGHADAPGLGSQRATLGAAPTSEDLLVLAEVNKYRALQGLSAMRFEPRLFAAARLHSDEQLRSNYLGHSSPDPERARLSQRLAQEGYVGRMYAEVVASNYNDVATVVDAWMQSPTHRAVLLDPELSEGAFCRLDSADRLTNRWTGDFGAPVALKAVVPPAPSLARPATPAPRSQPSALPSGAVRASVPPAVAPRSQPLASAVPPPAPPRPPPPALKPVPYSFGSDSGNTVPPMATALPPPPVMAPRVAPQPTFTRPAPAPYRPPVVIRRRPAPCVGGT